MMATATPPPDGLQLRGADCALGDLSLSYCRVTAASPKSQDKLKVKKRKLSPPRQPPPPPPLAQDLPNSSARSLAARDDRPSGQSEADDEELESFKKLGLVVCPHRIEPQSNTLHTGSDLALHPPGDSPGSATHSHTMPEHTLFSCSQGFDSKHSVGTFNTMSPSPLPLPEPDFELEGPLFQNMTHYSSHNLTSCGVDDQHSPVSSSFPLFLNSQSPTYLSTAVRESFQSHSLSPTDRGYQERVKRGMTPDPPIDDSTDNKCYVQLVRDESSKDKAMSEPFSTKPVNISRHQHVSRQLPAHHRLNHSVQSEGEYFKATVPVSVARSLGSLEEEQQDSHLVLLTEEEPLFIGKTRPVPPPKQSVSPTYSSSPPQQSTAGKYTRPKILQSTQSSPALLSSEAPRPRSISFLQCKAGDDCGSFIADYLGSREIDSYINCVDTAAKQLTESKAVEVVAYVSSEKVRLAPPRNAALLFKSFAMRDILAVEMCTKNKRIVGIVVWKKGQKSVPVCHILRCPNNLVSNSMYDSLIHLTQQVDEVTGFEKSSMTEDSSLALISTTQPPSDTSFTTSEEDHTPSYRVIDPICPTEPLHKFAVIYVGNARSCKLHSVNDVIQKVLTENKPSKSREVTVCLSLSQVQLVQLREGEEVVCEAHDTSRIRAIGVYNTDKRYIGYIIKEEGKPLSGHVLRCTSAALMVSLTSFLRQSCQMMVYQRGGSFYDELSADGSEDYELSVEGAAHHSGSPGLVKRIRTLTMSISNRTPTTTPTLTRPSFQSHTHLRKQLSPIDDLPPKKRDSVQNSLFVSPQNITNEDYARFSVTYVGSATLDIPFTKASVFDALKAFSEGGIAAGQAAVTKNVIDMQISALSISLSDGTHKLFVTRNYTRKQVEGFCVHPTDSKYFSFATHRPGFHSSMKVHVFERGEEPSSQIVDAIQYWLEIQPTSV